MSAPAEPDDLEPDQAAAPLRPRDECIADAGTWFADLLADLDARSPREAAELAARPGGLSVDEIEDLIRVDRGLEPRHTDARVGAV